MRKLMVLLIAVALFLVLAAPVLAIDTAEVRVTIGDVKSLEVTGNWAMPSPVKADYPPGPGILYSTTNVNIGGWNNCIWDLHAWQDPWIWDGGATTVDWDVYLAIVGGDDWKGPISVEATPTVLIPAIPGGTPGIINLDYKAKLEGLVWADPKGYYHKVIHIILTGHC